MRIFSRYANLHVKYDDGCATNCELSFMRSGERKRNDALYRYLPILKTNRVTERRIFLGDATLTRC